MAKKKANAGLAAICKKRPGLPMCAKFGSGKKTAGKKRGR
jgi:hypothetical protein